MTELLSLSTRQLDSFEKLKYKDVNLTLKTLKFEYPTEFTTFLISKTKIGNTIFYLEPSPPDSFYSYLVFEIIEKDKGDNSLLHDFLFSNFKQKEITDTDKQLFSGYIYEDDLFDKLKLYENGVKKIYYLDHRYDTSINRTINQAMIMCSVNYKESETQGYQRLFLEGTHRRGSARVPGTKFLDKFLSNKKGFAFYTNNGIMPQKPEAGVTE
jgi:hypothetical protein